jgi:NAD(P)-dependent dehydrogenase (short-subunit alcohol dehydrogenase family)
MSLDFGLRNVHVLVTGASGGIGLEAVRTFLQVGARVTAHYNTNIGELASLQEVVSLKADVRDAVSVNKLFEDAAELQGSPVSCLVVVCVNEPAYRLDTDDHETRIMEYFRQMTRMDSLNFDRIAR